MAYSKTIFMGNMVRDPELRVTSGGKSVCNFTVAVKRRRQDVTDFHDCVAWEKTAEAISKHFHKGKEILVEGELQKRSYEKEGNKIWVTELVVDNFSFVGRKEVEQSQGFGYGGGFGGAPSSGFSEIPDTDGDLPF